MEEKHVKRGDETRRMEACTAVGCVKGCVKHECETKSETSDDGAEIRGQGDGR